MNALRSILLHLDASPRSAVRLALAQDLARRHGAAVTALYAVMPAAIEMPYAYAEGAAGLLPILQQLDAQRRNGARALFDRANSSASANTTAGAKPGATSGATSGAPMQWRELAGSMLYPGTQRHALCFDLLLLGQYDEDAEPPSGVPRDFVASTLVESGKPAIVVPCVGDFTSVGKDVLIAWKTTRESARAVAAAMPLLAKAHKVHVVAEADTTPSELADLEAWLRVHGCEAKLERHGALPAESPGDGLLSLAADASADLLVMGCYGHSRARELVLGGATRTVLKTMTLPVLMAH